MTIDTDVVGSGGAFPVTRWTLIRSPGRSEAERRAALGALLAAYWKPLYVCARRKGLTVEDAEDAVQGLCGRLVAGDVFAQADPALGRFRTYLRASLDHHLANLHEGRTAQKRGGGAAVLSLDVEEAEGLLRGTAAPPTSDVFDREWALGVVERALRALRGEFEGGTRTGPFDAFLAFFRGVAPPAAAAAATAGMSAAAYKAFIHRTRVRFREIVRGLVADTVADSRDIDREVADLIRALSG